MLSGGMTFAEAQPILRRCYLLAMEWLSQNETIGMFADEQRRTLMADTLLAIEGLTVELPRFADRRYAIEDVSLTLERDEILCVVGESGSGKSVMARTILRLFPDPSVRAVAGRVLFAGENLLEATAARLR